MPKLLDRARRLSRLRRHSRRTEQAYIFWIKRFIHFHGRRHLTGTYWLMASLLYGAGLRLLECCTLRVKDLDFAYRQIRVRDGKGGKDRVTVLPSSLVGPVTDQLARVRALHERDLAHGHGKAPPPHAPERKYPNATKEWRWQFVFPSSVLSPDRRTGEVCRFHTAESGLQKAVKRAVEAAGVD